MTAALALQCETELLEKRRYVRVALGLEGRYMLTDGQEYLCKTIDFSPGGIAVEAAKVGRYGERVVFYIKELGRIEGHIVRRSRGHFAIDIKAPESKKARLAERIGWILSHQDAAGDERREDERTGMNPLQTVLSGEDGREHVATLLEVSLSRARLAVAVRPRIGARVRLGQQSAVVERHEPDALVVKFDAET
jgi:hypothetical protein